MRLIVSLAMALLAAGGQAADPATSGVLSGRVVDAGTGAPIQGASVSLAPVLPPSSGRSTPPFSPTLLLSLTNQTNVDGAFEITGVPAGRWRVDVRKDGFIPLSSTTSSLTLLITGRTRIPDVRLDRGGAIEGRVLDASGKPAVRVSVAATQQVRNRDGTLRLTGGAAAQTNDLGEFRVAGLAPGQYVVYAQPPPSFVNPFTGGSPTAAPTVFVPTVYPGLSDIAQAIPVAVSAGVATRGIEFSMLTAAAYQVFGVVVDAEGRPVGGAAVRMVQSRPPLSTNYQGSPSAADGTFVIVNVPDGRYTAQASLPIVVKNSSGGVSASLSFGLNTPGSVQVVVQGGNVEGLRLVVTQP